MTRATPYAGHAPIFGGGLDPETAGRIAIALGETRGLGTRQAALRLLSAGPGW